MDGDKVVEIALSPSSIIYWVNNMTKRNILTMRRSMMTTRRKLGAAGVAAASVLLLASCGSEADRTDGAPIKQLDASLEELAEDKSDAAGGGNKETAKDSPEFRGDMSWHNDTGNGDDKPIDTTREKARDNNDGKATARLSDIKFERCEDAYEVGISNIPTWSPLYRDKLDGDKNGVACTSPWWGNTSTSGNTTERVTETVRGGMTTATATETATVTKSPAATGTATATVTVTVTSEPSESSTASETSSSESTSASETSSSQEPSETKEPSETSKSRESSKAKEPGETKEPSKTEEPKNR